MASTAVAKAGSDRNRTFLAILIPVLILFCAIAFVSSLLGVAAGAHPRKKGE